MSILCLFGFKIDLKVRQCPQNAAEPNFPIETDNSIIGHKQNSLSILKKLLVATLLVKKLENVTTAI